MKLKQSDARKKLIYIRYFAPIVLAALLLCSLWIPCLQYTTADVGTHSNISLAELLKNSWDQVRSYLFGGGEQDAANRYFSQVTLGILIVTGFLFVLAIAVMIYQLIGALHYFSHPEDTGNARILWITLMPNRIVVCVLEALIFPLLAFPHLILLLYENILHYHVGLTLHFPEPLVFGAIFYVAMVILTAVSADAERALGMDPFCRRSRGVDEDDGNNEEDEYEDT